METDKNTSAERTDGNELPGDGEEIITSNSEFNKWSRTEKGRKCRKLTDNEIYHVGKLATAFAAGQKLAKVESCLTCRFFLDCECRRYPPKHFIMGDKDYIDVAAESSFPIVHEDSWCGEYQSK